METAESTIRSLIRRAANAYTAGPAIHDAGNVCECFSREGVSATVCYWNIESDHPTLVYRSYIDIIDLMSCLKPNGHLSIKAPALGFDTNLLESILERAKRAGVLVHFDSLAPELADRTFSVIHDVRNYHVDIGCTLPGRWKRSLIDADNAIEMGLQVRVVKGEWPALNGDNVDVRKGFLDVIDRLVAQRARHVAVATHDTEVAHKALDRLRTAGISAEVELLYGLPLRPMFEMARTFQLPVRIYVPFGHPRLPYCLKEVGKNPRMIVWFMRDLWRGGRIQSHMNGTSRRHLD